MMMRTINRSVSVMRLQSSVKRFLSSQVVADVETPLADAVKNVRINVFDELPGMHYSSMLF